MSKRWEWFAAAIVGLPLMFFFLSSLQTMPRRRSSKDLEVEFVVLDAETGQPIPHNKVWFFNPHPSDLCGREYREAQFSRVADSDGRVTLFAQQCMCSGMRNWHRDTFAIHVPAWYILVSAAGYQTSELVDLQVRRGPSQRSGVCPDVVRD